MSTFAWARRPGAKATTTPEPSPSPAYAAGIVRLGWAGVNGAGLRASVGAEDDEKKEQHCAACCRKGYLGAEHRANANCQAHRREEAI
jgi:hypothetical protein